jgi:NitT/TauT family transport system permease protein
MRLARRSRTLTVVGARTALIIAALVLVEALVRGGLISPFALAPSSEIIEKIVGLVRDGTVVGPLLQTLVEVAITFVVVAIAGVFVGFCSWRWGLLRRSIEPLMLAVYAIPTIVFYPILLVVFGIGAPSVMAMGFLLGFTPIVLGVRDALGSVDPVLVRMATVLGATPLAKYAKVIFPAALPGVGAALRLGFSYVVIGIISGEFLVSTGGLGKLVANYYDGFQVSSMYAAAVFIVLLSAVINSLLERLK